MVAPFGPMLTGDGRKRPVGGSVLPGCHFIANFFGLFGPDEMTQKACL